MVVKSRERAREFYRSACELFYREMYGGAFVLAYHGLVLLNKHEDFRCVWEALMNGVEVDVSEVERALRTLGSALGEEGEVVVEMDLADLFALCAAVVAGAAMVFEVGPLWLDAVLIPFIAAAVLFLVCRLRGRS